MHRTHNVSVTPAAFVKRVRQPQPLAAMSSVFRHILAR
jgi:hypothetical protein